MAYLDVKLPDGRRSIGSAFHIGDGVFVTARHVLEGNKLLEMKITEPVAIGAKEFFGDVTDEYVEAYNKSLRPVLGHDPLFKHYLEPLEVEKGPFYCGDARIDLAILKVVNVHPEAAVVRLGIHLDDWVYRYPWQLSEAIIFGYPPIPMTWEPHLVPATAAVHTFTTLRNSPHVHFILSATPRGGFSGGLALHEQGFALGVITGGLVQDDQPTELGFFAVLSVEPIHELLKEHDLIPKAQRKIWDRVGGDNTNESDAD